MRPAELLSGPAGEASAVVRARVEAARARQHARFGGRIADNASIPAELILDAVLPTGGALRALQSHMDGGSLSARVSRRLLKVARTLADLDGSAMVEVGHVHRAVGLRFEGDALGEAA